MDFTMNFYEGVNTKTPKQTLDSLVARDQICAAGFVGKTSEIQWLHAATLAETNRANEETRPSELQQKSQCMSESDQLSSYSFWAYEEDDDIDMCINVFELPQQKTAERLVWCYMARVQDSFPILARKSFRDQFQTCLVALHSGSAHQLNKTWQTILNLVFAIGARYSYLAGLNWGAEEHDHLIYRARARSLGMVKSSVTDRPNLHQVQMLGLFAFYWLSVGHVNQ
jgi:hypothetical protein